MQNCDQIIGKLPSIIVDKRQLRHRRVSAATVCTRNWWAPNQAEDLYYQGSNSGTPQNTDFGEAVARTS